MTLLSSEESNLIVDHHYALNYSRSDENYYVSQLFKDGDITH